MTSSSAGVQKVAIIGGGVAGLTLALALQRHGIRVSVHEKYDHYQSQSTGFLIWSYAIKILQDLDVPVQNFGAPLEVFRMHGRKGQPVVDMPIGAVSRRNGAESYEVNRRRLSQTLAAMVGNDLVLGQECVSVVNHPDHATAHFADGSCVDADVVIACDGANSALRQQMFPDVRLRMLGSGGWIAVIDAIPEGLEPGVQMDFWLPGCKAGVAQLGHGETRWYVAFNTIQLQADVAKKEQIQQQIKRVPELLQRCLALTDEEQMVFTQAGDLLALSPWYRDRVLLIGDAAHATSPYAGMGACSAIADAAVLADLIASGRPVAEIFQCFEAARKPAADAVIKESRHGLDRSTCGGLRSWMRDLMFANIPSPKLDQIVEDMVTGR